jgi:hypothetical protein
VAVASAFRFKLTKEEILVASGDQTNASLNVLDQLIRRHVITQLEGWKMTILSVLDIASLSISC